MLETAPPDRAGPSALRLRLSSSPPSQRRTESLQQHPEREHERCPPERAPGRGKAADRAGRSRRGATRSSAPRAGVVASAKIIRPSLGRAHLREALPSCIVQVLILTLACFAVRIGVVRGVSWLRSYLWCSSPAAAEAKPSHRLAQQTGSRQPAPRTQQPPLHGRLPRRTGHTRSSSRGSRGAPWCFRAGDCAWTVPCWNATATAQC